MKLKPQAVDVRDRIMARGPRGLHSFELHGGLDGGATVADPSKRVSELREAGYEIAIARERLHGDALGCRYVFISEQQAVEVGADTNNRGRQSAAVGADPGGLPASAGSEPDAAAGVRSPARSGGGSAPTLVVEVDATGEEPQVVGFRWVDNDAAVAA